jgi:hypothetical protein
MLKNEEKMRLNHRQKLRQLEAERDKLKVQMAALQERRRVNADNIKQHKKAAK